MKLLPTETMYLLLLVLSRPIRFVTLRAGMYLFTRQSTARSLLFFRCFLKHCFGFLRCRNVTIILKCTRNSNTVAPSAGVRCYCKYIFYTWTILKIFVGLTILVNSTTVIINKHASRKINWTWHEIWIKQWDNISLIIIKILSILLWTVHNIIPRTINLYSVNVTVLNGNCKLILIQPIPIFEY